MSLTMRSRNFVVVAAASLEACAPFRVSARPEPGAAVREPPGSSSGLRAHRFALVEPVTVVDSGVMIVDEDTGTASRPMFERSSFRHRLTVHILRELVPDAQIASTGSFSPQSLPPTVYVVRPMIRDTRAVNSNIVPQLMAFGFGFACPPLFFYDLLVPEYEDVNVTGVVQVFEVPRAELSSRFTTEVGRSAPILGGTGLSPVYQQEFLIPLRAEHGMFVKWQEEEAATAASQALADVVESAVGQAGSRAE